MAGIGFELRRLLRSDSYAGLLRGYGYAGLISSGPWVFSIVGVMLIGVLSTGVVTGGVRQDQFLVAVTYLMASSLVLTGFLQLFFSRFVADRIFEERPDAILPNLIGVLALTTGVSGAVSLPIVEGLFDEPLAFRLILQGSFVVLCDLWLVVVMLSSLKAYRAVLGIFFLGYALTVALALGLRGHGLTGLMGGFFGGQAWMLAAFLLLVIQRFPSTEKVAFAFLERRNAFPGLMVTGFLYNLGIWADKLVFWFDPRTSEPVIGPLRASILYDLPMFLAYLSIVPGMAVFLVRIETDFAEQHAAFYAGIREGASLGQLERLKENMVLAIRQGIYEVFKVQGMTILLLLLAGPRLLRFFGISPLHLPLYHVDLIAVGTQVLLLAILNVFFYLDKRRIALGLSALLLVSNAGLTWVTHHAGARFYGYGFGVAVLLTSVVGLVILSRKLERLEFDTYMMQ